MESTHQNDVVFTRDSLNKFIKLIKTEGIKNLDYYIMSPDMDVKNVIGEDEFSLGEKTLFSGNIGIVNKSYYTGDPYIEVDLENNYNENLKILKYNIKNVFNFPFNDETDSISLGAISVGKDYYLTTEQWNSLSTVQTGEKKIEVKQNGTSNIRYASKDQIADFSTTNINNPIMVVINPADIGSMAGAATISKEINASNYNFVINPKNETSFGYVLDSDIIASASNFLNYLFLEKEDEDKYKYYQIENGNDTTKFNKYHEIIAPYEFSIVKSPENESEFIVKKIDGETSFNNQSISQKARDIDENNNLNNQKGLYYQGLRKVKYNKFIDENDTQKEGAELDNKNIDIFISGNGYNIESKTNYPTFKIGDPLLQAFQKETISDIEEMTYTGNKDSNFYQIFWNDTNDHLLQNIKISYGYNENGTVAAANNVQLMYNYTIPVRSIKIKSWEQLQLNNATKVFPNIENKGYSAHYDIHKQIYGKWQPNDLVNLFSAYQVLKGREAEISKVEDVRAFSLSSTTNSTLTSSTNNAHQIAFTPNNFDNAMMNIDVYKDLSTTNTNYNNFEYIVLDSVPRTYNYSITASNANGALPFGNAIVAGYVNPDGSGTFNAATTIQSATVTNKENSGIYQIEYYDAAKTDMSEDRSNISGKWLPAAAKNGAPTSSITYSKSISSTRTYEIPFPVKNSHIDSVYYSAFGWNMEYVPVLSDIYATITEKDQGSSNNDDEINNNITFNFQPLKVIDNNNSSWNPSTVTANINITMNYQIKTNKTNEQGRIPIYVLPLDSASFTASNSSKYSNKIINKDTKYYGLFMQNQQKKTTDLKYYLIGYLPQNYFWETDLLNTNPSISDDERKECRKGWRILLQDRLNNSINNSLFSNTDIKNRFVDLHKDLNIFDIVLSSSTKTDGTAIQTSMNGFYEKDLGFYYKEDVNTSREGLYRLQYNPNVIDSADTQFFSNYTNFDVNLKTIQKENKITYMDTTISSQTAIYTASYIEVGNISELVKKWEEERQYGTITTTATPTTAANCDTIRGTDYFLYTKVNNSDTYKEIDKILTLDVNEIGLSTTGDNLDNTISALNNSLNILKSKLLYKRIEQIPKSYTIHPSIFNDINILNDEIISFSYYQEVTPIEHSSNIYHYYSPLTINSKYDIETYRATATDIQIFYLINEFIENEGNGYNQNYEYYNKITDNNNVKFELLNIIDDEDFQVYKQSGKINLYYKDQQYKSCKFNITHNGNVVIAELTNPVLINYYDKLARGEISTNNIIYYLQIPDNGLSIMPAEKYYITNNGQDQLINNFYMPHTYYYYDGTKYVFDDYEIMNSNQQYYQLITINLLGSNILNRLDKRFYNGGSNYDHVKTFINKNNQWYYKNNDDTEIQIQVPTEQKAFYIYIQTNNNIPQLMYTENLTDLPYTEEDNELQVLELTYDYIKITEEENPENDYYKINIDTTTNSIYIKFKYSFLIKQTSDQDDLYVKINPLDKIITDPQAGMDYYLKKYMPNGTATSAVASIPISDGNIVSYDTNLFTMYLNQQLNLEKYYYWNYDSRKSKECDGTFTVELAKNPYVCARNVGWYWSYGVDEKAEGVNSITFGVSTSATATVKNLITPFYDYMTKAESDKIFTQDTYTTTNKYEGFSTTVTMSITDKTRIAETVSILGSPNTQTISTVNSTTNIPSVYMLHKLLNRKNLFNIDYTTNYDYINGESGINTAHNQIGWAYQDRRYSMIKNINFFDIENQMFAFNTGSSTTYIPSTLSNTRSSTNPTYLFIEPTNNSNSSYSNVLDFDQFALAQTGTDYIYSKTAKNGIISKIVGILQKGTSQESESTDFFTTHEYREARKMDQNKFNNAKKYHELYKKNGDNIKQVADVNTETYDAEKTYYYKYHKYIKYNKTPALTASNFQNINNDYPLYYYEDNRTSNPIISVSSTASYDSSIDYYIETTTSFNAEKYIIKYLDNKDHEKITNKTKINKSLPCFNSDGWLLLRADRNGWNESKGFFDYLCLMPEKYYINSKDVYIYFIYQLYYDANSTLTKINLNQDCCIYYDGQYGSAIRTNDGLKILNIDITKMCHLKDPFYETHVGTQKIYQTYFQAIKYWYKNPYPGGAPVFFEDWCVSGKNLKSEYNAKETANRNYYYYGIKLPKDLLIEKNDTFYQYPYSFDIVNSNNESIFLTNTENNHYLVTYRLVEDYLPKMSYSNHDDEKGFTNSKDGEYTLDDFVKNLVDMLGKTDEVGKSYEYCSFESTDSYLTINDHTKVFGSVNDTSSQNKINSSDYKFKFYTNSNNTYEQTTYIKLSNESEDPQSKNDITFNKIKGKYYQYCDNENFKLTPDKATVDIKYNVYISDSNPTDDNFTRYQLYKYNDTVYYAWGTGDSPDAIESTDEIGDYPDTLDINEANIKPYYYIANIEGSGFKEDFKDINGNLPSNGKYMLNISAPFEYNKEEPLYLEKFENTLGFRHIFLNIPNKKYTKSFTSNNPFPNQIYYLDPDGCLRDNEGKDQSPNGTFSISSGNLNPGVLVQIRGFNNDGEYEGDLNGGTLNNVTFGKGILHVKDTTDAWRKPIIDIINAKLKVKPENEGGNIYASIVTEGGISAAKKIKGERLYGAIWNDYAEYRQTNGIEPGRCVIETGTGELRISTERLQGGANITSDTFGMGVGETDLAKTPIAVSGRVLAYPYEDRNIFKPGDAICSGPNGTVSIMTREEIKEWPDRIVGYVSEIPYYETWGTGKVKVNGRIWIKIH